MSIEHERAALQSKLDQLHSRLEYIQGSLFSAGSTAAAPASVRVNVKSVAAKPASAGTQPRAARGELKQRILEALAAAGSAGIRVRDLATSIGSKPESLHSWFQFARRSIKTIRKAGKGRYRLVGALPEAAAATAKPAKAARKAAGKQRGYLTDAIQDALRAAGKDGVRVGDLAKTLGIKPPNLFVWFATTGKKFKAIKRIAPGHYQMQS